MEWRARDRGNRWNILKDRCMDHCQLHRWGSLKDRWGQSEGQVYGSLSTTLMGQFDRYVYRPTDGKYEGTSREQTSCC